MKKLELNQMEVVLGGGSLSYAAGLICGYSGAATLTMFILSGPIGGVAVGVATGLLCGTSMAAAHYN
jgi:uncharacterized protein YaaW (UPF0174 family)